MLVRHAGVFAGRIAFAAVPRLGSAWNDCVD